jgi:hypothetical protein
MKSGGKSKSYGMQTILCTHYTIERDNPHGFSEKNQRTSFKSQFSASIKKFIWEVYEE